jgi:RNA polymerase sigma factor (sigma-70 family)
VVLLVGLPISGARDVMDPGPSPFALAAQVERNAIVKEILRKLSPRERRLVSLYYDAEQPLAEVASKWRVSEKTVWKLHRQILETLGKSLAARQIFWLKEIL